MAHKTVEETTTTSTATTPVHDVEKQLEPLEPPQDVKPADPTEKDDHEYPPLSTVLPVMGALYLAMFLVSLDRMIIATAIPQITNDFDSLGDVGWYVSAYMITACAMLPLYGRIYTFYSTKWVYLGAIALFEAGSAICGAAPNSLAFILGRAIAGLGSSGIMGGGITLILFLVPLSKRPAYQGFMGAIFGVSSVLGPLVGGAFTDNVTWRWCFYINLPIGGVAMAVILFVLRIDTRPAKAGTGLKEQFLQLDPLGNLFFLPSIICLLLALQWGGSTYSWGNARIVVLLVMFSMLLLAFIAVQIWKKDTATIPLRIIKNRTVYAACGFSLIVGSAMMLLFYYVAIYFQAIKGVSPVRSAIYNLAMVLSLVFGSIFSGILVQKIGYYKPPIVVAAIMMPIGAGLITTFNPHTPKAEWIVYQIIFGLGMGVGMQQGNIACQAVLARADVPTAISLVFFFQLLGGSVFTSVGQNLFSQKLVSEVAHNAGIDPRTILNIGATDLRKFISPERLPAVLDAYATALRQTFYVALGVSCLAIFPAMAIKWGSVKDAAKKQEKKPAEDKASETQSQAESA